MACDPFESLLVRTKRDAVLSVDRPGEYETKISRTETGSSVYQLEWYPAMGSHDWTETHDGDAARAKLRQWYGSNTDNEGRLALEAKFPVFSDDDA